MFLNKTIAAVFAHPDDESFGPGGTLAKLAKNNRLYLLCATKGEKGNSSIKISTPLAKIRANELKKAGKILGIKKIFFLGFKDGSLNNNRYHQLATKIKKVFLQIRPEVIITYEMRGVSGHLDHIAISLATSFVAVKLKFVKTILYYCLTKNHRQLIKDYFIFFPPAYKKKEINLTVNLSSVWEKKINAIKAHASQRKDGKEILKIISSLPKEEHFIKVNL